MKRELWIQFADKEAFETQEETLYGVSADSDGADAIVVYLADRKAMKRLPASKNVEITSALIQTLYAFYAMLPTDFRPCFLPFQRGKFQTARCL